MSVKFQHPEYQNMSDKWDRCQIVARGQDAVHDATVRFLPSLSEQDPMEYKAYRERALFYNATWRTIVGLQGMIFRKPTRIVVPTTVQPMLDDIDMSGTSMLHFSMDLVEAVLTVGRVGVFVDYPNIDITNATAADAITNNFRPMLKLYSAQSIINWKTRTHKNATVLSMVVLTELKKVPKDEFEDIDVTQYRVLDLFDGDVAGVVNTVYRVRVFEVQMKNGKEEDVLVEGPFFPKVNGKALDYIPFQFMGVDDTNWEIDEPPLIDLVDVNLSHYRSTADYEHGCHFTGLPTAIISGYTPDAANPEKFYIGSTSAWVFPNANAKATFLEFTGQGLDCLKQNLERKEHMMAILGSRILEAQPNGTESANTAAIHRGGEQSILASVAQSISLGMKNVMKTFCAFAGAASDEVDFALNRDFFPVPMDSLMLTAVIAGWQNQAYSYDTMFDLLKQGEFVDIDAKAEDEQKAIDANPPPVLDVPTTPGDRAGNGPAQGAAKGTNSRKGAAPTQKQLQNR